VDDAELQALYSRASSPYFNLQTGVRQDFNKGPSRTDAVLGIQGLAPQWFEVDAAAFVSNHGDLTARLETEYELFLTQRLILQPRLELDAAAQDIPALGIGSGLGTAELGLRLRYEIRREIAPYVGIAWQRDIGETADHTRAAGERVQHTAFVAGLRLWW
jgi:copper resistance protein B